MTQTMGTSSIVVAVRRRTRLVALAEAAAVCAAAASFLVLDLGDPGPERRDVDEYQGYVTGRYASGSTWAGPGEPVHYPIEDDRAWAADHPEVMLAEGDRACQWLADEPSPPTFWARTARYGTHEMVTRYLKVAGMQERLSFSNLGLRDVVTGAWAYLCPVMRSEKTVLASGD